MRNNEMKNLFETGARLFGCKHLAEILGVSRVTLMRYRTGVSNKIPYSVVVRMSELIEERLKKKNEQNLYGVRQNITKKLGRPAKGKK